MDWLCLAPKLRSSELFNETYDVQLMFSSRKHLYLALLVIKSHKLNE